MVFDREIIPIRILILISFHLTQQQQQPKEKKLSCTKSKLSIVICVKLYYVTNADMEPKEFQKIVCGRRAVTRMRLPPSTRWVVIPNMITCGTCGASQGLTNNLLFYQQARRLNNDDVGKS